MSQDGDITNEVEYGLILPDGSIIWPPQQWHGRTFATPEDRQHLLSSVRLSERNLGFPPGGLVSQFAWATRTKVTAILYTDFAQEPMPLVETGWTPPVEVAQPEAEPDVQSAQEGY